MIDPDIINSLIIFESSLIFSATHNLFCLTLSSRSHDVKLNFCFTYFHSQETVKTELLNEKPRVHKTLCNFSPHSRAIAHATLSLIFHAICHSTVAQ